MIEQNSRKSKSVNIPENLWSTYDQVAREMGTDPSSLINQALFTYARLNGFTASGASGAAPATGANGVVAKGPRPAPAPEPDFDEPAPEPQEEEEEEAAAPEPEPEPEPAPPQPRRAPPPVLGGGARRGDSAPPADDFAPPPPPARRSAPASEGAQRYDAPMDDDPKRREVAERVLETAAELERLIKGPKDSARPSPAAVNSDLTNNGAQAGAEKLLYLTSDDGELLKVTKDRFLIGRGKHCDFVINSGKVSREHAAVVRDGTDFFIEDLGSSNGTWFNKQRIKRRKIDDGDEYFICSEKVRCLFR